MSIEWIALVIFAAAVGVIVGMWIRQRMDGDQ